MAVIWEFAFLKQFEEDIFYNRENTIPEIDRIFFAEWDAELIVTVDDAIVMNRNGVGLRLPHS